MIDTHSHLYSTEFDNDIDEVIQRAINVGVKHIILPNIDSESLPRMLSLESKNPIFFTATIGLHPTSVKENFQEELNIIESELARREYKAIGEIGIDLYWDSTYLKEQILVFKQQLNWSLKYDLPVIIHVRNSFSETFEILEEYRSKGLRGVFHSFTGTLEQAKHIIDFGFLVGINGIVTFKNADISKILSEIELKYIILETDSPYLTPAPYRGKRNESAYILQIFEKITQIYGLPFEKIENITTKNAINLFNI